ncbi:MAG: TolC family protein [Chlorobiales bacterium]
MMKVALKGGLLVVMVLSGCTSFNQSIREANTSLPESFGSMVDTNSVVQIQWREYFKDPYLTALIDTALKNNQEINIILQEIETRRNEILAREGEYLPSVEIGAEAGADKGGNETQNEKVNELLKENGKSIPDVLGTYRVGAFAKWEVDIWNKLHNAKDAAVLRYLSSVEGKNFAITQLVAEISEVYYDLLALDNLLKTVNENVEIQSNALLSVRLQKEAAKVSQLAVNRFEAQLLKTKNLQYEIKQRITEAENRLNFLTGHYSTKIERSSASFLEIPIDTLQLGVPSQLLRNRPDLRQAELEIAASKLDVEVARANFYPSLSIRAGVGFESFNPSFLLNPTSLFYNLAGEIMAPLINRKGIEAAYNSANARQLQAVIRYEQSILNAFVDVQNQVAKIKNFRESFAVKSNEVKILNESVEIANSLFNSARADYVEVLLTQEEALEQKLELIEVKAKLLQGKVQLYRSLGGGWN